MAKGYILVEGINLYAHIYDTDQLSVIRGSSFLYKEAIETLASDYKGRMEAVSTGASSGLFVTDLPVEEVQKLKQAIVEQLNTDPCYRHLTFAVVSTEAESLQVAKENLYAQLRWQQLQSLSLQPDKSDLTSIPCELSGTRIASFAKRRINGDKAKQISDSVLQRYKVGRKSKYDYYANEISDSDQRTKGSEQAPSLKQRLADYEFAQNIQILCADPNQPLDAKDQVINPDAALMYPQLARKMAVVYIDGNKFGKRQAKFIQYEKERLIKEKQLAVEEAEIAAQQDFDKTIKELRGQFLANELALLLQEEREFGCNPLGYDEKSKNKKTLRLETLLWGGDEMIFVLPAWKGFDFLQRFFNYDWKLRKTDSEDDRLTHAAGIVFCQANTPIRIIQKLARDLAEQVKNTKDQQGKEIGRQQNGWDYLVLESVDYPTNESLEDYFTERYGKKLQSVRRNLLTGIAGWNNDDGNDAQKALSTFLYGDPDSDNPKRPALSRGQLYQVVKTIKKTTKETAKAQPEVLQQTTFKEWQQLIKPDPSIDAQPSAIEMAEQRLYQVSENQDGLKELKHHAENWFGLDIDQPEQRAWFWIHLLELWDYLIPKKNDELKEGAV